MLYVHACVWLCVLYTCVMVVCVLCVLCVCAGFHLGRAAPLEPFLLPLGNCIIKIHIDVVKCLTKCMSNESMHM